MLSDKKSPTPKFRLGSIYRNRPDAAYKVTLLTDAATESLLKPISKTKRRLRTFRKRFVQAVTVFLLTMLALAGLAMPASAHDNPLDF